jgi:site-specific DNA recombinase
MLFMNKKESQQCARRVIALPITNTHSLNPILEDRPKKKVAAYARVSTETDEQQNSYEAQVKFYTEYIKSKDEWKFVQVYTDEGISGTSTAKREGFTEMINDALAGKIDLILTKSVSRFARNTVDSLVTIRKLKEKGVECFFEKENIWTFDGKGELLLTIMSSLAQEESRSISENVKWGIRKRFADGKLIVGYKNFLGYDKGPDDSLVINEEQAKIVRFIFSEFLSGKSTNAIANCLTRDKVPTVTGKPVWNETTITGILRNEKYKGDALLQKTYVADFLTKKQIVNHGEVPMYLVENDHPAIITREQYDAAQAMLDKVSKKRSHKDVSPFCGKVICADCGSVFSPKTWHSNDKYKRTIWQCLNKYNNDTICTTPHLSEEELQDIYMKAVNKLFSQADVVRKKVESIVFKVLDISALEKQRLELAARQEATISEIENSMTGGIQDTEEARANNDLMESLKDIQKTMSGVISEINGKKARKASIKVFLDELSKEEPITRFDAQQFMILVDHITVHSKTNVNVTFKDGTVI